MVSRETEEEETTYMMTLNAHILVSARFSIVAENDDLSEGADG